MNNIRERYGNGYPKEVIFGVGTFGAITKDKSKLFNKNQTT